MYRVSYDVIRPRDVRDQILQDFRAGLSREQIASKYHVGYGSVCKFVRDVFGKRQRVRASLGGAVEVKRIRTRSEPLLTERQRQILQTMADTGGTYQHISMRLGVSYHTLKAHMTAIIRKLNARDKTHAVVIAWTRGWIT